MRSEQIRQGAKGKRGLSERGQATRENARVLCWLCAACLAVGLVTALSGCSRKAWQDRRESASQEEMAAPPSEEVTIYIRTDEEESSPEAGGGQETEGGQGEAGEGQDKDQEEAEPIELPEVYDYRKIGRAPKAGDQKELGTCWAFSSLMALESTLLPEESLVFSADHMSRMNSFSLGQEEGGHYAMSMAYLLAWQGPVLEEDDPYGDGQSPEGLAPVRHVQEIRLLEPKDYTRIKEAVYTIGGVQSSLYTTMQDPSDADRYYNKETCGYYYPGEERSNHNLVIVGWDDHYPKEAFNQQPEGDGAFICLNSWGPDFGEEGCIYVSYYDTNIGDVNVLYSGITDTEDYTGIYQSDLCGWVGQLGYGRDEAYFANAYTAEGQERLKAVGFYATMPGSSYEVYAAAGLTSPEELELDEPLAKGSMEDAGFYTVRLSKEISLTRGEKFWVAVKLKTPGAIHPVAIEYQPQDGESRVDLSDGEVYLSADGKKWVSAEQEQSCNLCLKAYTVR